MAQLSDSFTYTTTGGHHRKAIMHTFGSLCRLNSTDSNFVNTFRDVFMTFVVPCSVDICSPRELWRYVCSRQLLASGADGLAMVLTPDECVRVFDSWNPDSDLALVPPPEECFRLGNPESQEG